jgi:hypothetical protein
MEEWKREAQLANSRLAKVANERDAMEAEIVRLKQSIAGHSEEMVDWSIRFALTHEQMALASKRADRLYRLCRRALVVARDFEGLPFGGNSRANEAREDEINEIEEELGDE